MQNMGGQPTIGDVADFFGDPSENETEELRGSVGFTPWDFVEVSEDQLKHEVTFYCSAFNTTGS